jgi:hypothetical protein
VPGWIALNVREGIFPSYVWGQTGIPFTDLRSGSVEAWRATDTLRRVNQENSPASFTEATRDAIALHVGVAGLKW